MPAAYRRSNAGTQLAYPETYSTMLIPKNVDIAYAAYTESPNFANRPLAGTAVTGLC